MVTKAAILALALAALLTAVRLVFNHVAKATTLRKLEAERETLEGNLKRALREHPHYTHEHCRIRRRLRRVQERIDRIREA